MYITAYGHCIVDGSKMQIQCNSFLNSLQIISGPGLNTETVIFHPFFFLLLFFLLVFFSFSREILQYILLGFWGGSVGFFFPL